MEKFLRGKLIQWNAKKGFGFIQPERGSKNIFIHISDFQEKGFTPYLGETIFYKIGKGKEGKEKAIYAYSKRKRLDHVGTTLGKEKQYKKSYSNRKYMRVAIIGVLLLIVGFFKREYILQDTLLDKKNKQVYYENDTILTDNSEKVDDVDIFLNETDKFIEKHTRKNQVDTTEKSPSIYKEESRHFRCDGRRYCSQMHSCEEATYFINHCRDTKMDGDGDGIPCERQWCGH